MSLRNFERTESRLSALSLSFFPENVFQVVTFVLMLKKKDLPNLKNFPSNGILNF